VVKSCKVTLQRKIGRYLGRKSGCLCRVEAVALQTARQDQAGCRISPLSGAAGVRLVMTVPRVH